MSLNNSWEVTEDDVFQVLQAHGHSHDNASAQQAVDAAQEESDRVIDAVLYYTDMESQVEAALSEIEDILLEANLLSGDKQFKAP